MTGARKYDTTTKPALGRVRRAFAGATHDWRWPPETLPERKAATDAAAAAGATLHELTEAVGGVTAWNAYVRELRHAGLLA